MADILTPPLSCPEADPPEFSALASEYADFLGGAPAGLPPDRGPEFELRIDTGTAPMPRSRPMKRWSQGGLDECRRQLALTRMDPALNRVARRDRGVRAQG